MTNQAPTATLDPRAALSRTLGSIHPLVTMERDGLVLIALVVAGSRAADYLTFEAASSASAIEVHELADGSVGTVEAVTKRQAVVLFAGDTITGGKQNRIINITMWLAANTTTRIPVSCLEAHRWDSGSRFSSGRKVDYELRARVNRSVGEQARAEAAMPSPSGQRSFRSDQGAVWAEISARETRAGTASPTAALHDLYARESDDLAAFSRAFPCPQGANGLAVGIGGKLVAVEVFDAPGTLAAQWSRLVEGAASAHLDHRRAIAAGAIVPPHHRHPDPGALARMLARTSAAVAGSVVSPSVGEGSDIRLAGIHVRGSALVRGERVVHLELFRVEV
jgi:hypothetical protein